MSSRIKGITIEIGGNTVELQKSLKEVDDKTKDINKELKDTERLLKLDPGNVELIAQKQSLLSKNIENTSEKLKTLKEAQQQVQKAFESGKASEESFNKIKREVIETEAALKKYGSELGKLSANERALGNLKTELKGINEALKLDPTSADLTAQKMKNLEGQLSLVKSKSDELTKSLQEAEKNAKNGDLGEGNVKKLRLELINTTNEYKKISKEMENTKNESKALTTEKERFEKLLRGLRKDTQDYADLLGNKLVKALDDSTANSGQYREALVKVANSSTNARVDIDKLVKKIDELDDTTVGNIKNELDSMANSAVSTKSSLDELGNKMLELNKLEGLFSGFEKLGIVVDKVKGVVDSALQEGHTQSRLKIRLDLDEEGTKAAREALDDLEAHNISPDEGIEALSKQINQNAKLSTEANIEAVTTAARLAYAYDSIDLNDLVKENNELAKILGISHKESLGIYNTLLRAGFPSDSINLVSEFGKQLHEAGYSAQEIQGVFLSGIDTGTWDTKKLFDGIKDGRNNMIEFGNEIDPTMDALLTKAGISSTQFQQLGRDIAGGGEAGKRALEQVAILLSGVEDDTTRNILGAEIFGKKWELSGEDITKTIIGMNEHIISATENQQKLNDTVALIDSDPLVKFQTAMGRLGDALIPVMTDLANIVGHIADFVAKYPGVAEGIGVVYLVLKPTAELISSLGISLAMIKKSGGVLKGLELAGAGAGAGAAGAGAGAAGAGAGALTGGAAVAGGLVFGAAALGTYGFIKHKEGEAREAIDEEIEAIDRANRMHEQAMLAQIGFKNKMNEVYKEIEENTGITFDEIKEAITTKTSEATNKGVANADDLKTKSLEYYKEVLEQAGYDFGQIEYDISLRTENASTSAGGFFEQIRATAEEKFGKAREHADTEFSALENTATTHSGDATTKSVGFFEQIREKAEEKFSQTKTAADTSFQGVKAAVDTNIPGAASAVATAFNNVPSTLEQGPFQQIRSKVVGLLGGLKSLFENFRPQIPAVEIPTVYYNQFVNAGSGTAIAAPTNDKGGIYTKPMIISIAERRPEFVGALDDLRAIVKDVVMEVGVSGGGKVEHSHSGTIRIEGYRDGEFDQMAEFLVEQFRRESRL